MIQPGIRNNWPLAAVAGAGVILASASNPMRKVLLGLSGIGAGGYILKASKIFTSLRQRITGVREGEERVELTKNRLICSVASLLLAAGGTVCAAAGAFEHIEGQMLTAVTNRGRRCLEMRQLIEEVVTQEQNLTISFASFEGTNGTIVRVNPFAKVIGIQRGLSPDGQLAALIDGFCKARSIKPISELAESATRGNATFADYVIKTVYEDYRSINCQHSIATGCIFSQEWPESIDIYKDNFPLWDNFTKVMDWYMGQGLEKNAHLQSLKESWDNMFRVTRQATKP